MTTPPPSYTFTWHPREHVHVTTVLLRERFGSGALRIVKWFVYLVLTLSVVLVFTSALIGDLVSVLRLGPLTAVVLVAVAYFGRITGGIHAWQVKRHDPNVNHPVTHTFGETALHVSTRTTEFDLKWDGLHKVRETPVVFMFYYNARFAYFLPKRAVGDEAEIAALRAIIRSRLPHHVDFQGQ